MPARRAALLPSLVLRPAAGVCKGAGPQLRHAARAAPAAQGAGARGLLWAYQQQGTAAACSQPVAAACGQAQVGSQPGQHSWRLQQLWGTTLAAAAAAAAVEQAAAAAAVHGVHAVQGAAHQQGVAALPPLLPGRKAQQLCIAQLQPATQWTEVGGRLGPGLPSRAEALSCTRVAWVTTCRGGMVAQRQHTHSRRSRCLQGTRTRSLQRKRRMHCTRSGAAMAAGRAVLRKD